MNSTIVVGTLVDDQHPDRKALEFPGKRPALNAKGLK
jgi:hypothetical protein